MPKVLILVVIISEGYKKNVAMLVGDGITAYDAGEIWHLCIPDSN